MIKSISKPIFSLCFLLVFTGGILAQVTTPRPSPSATLTQKVGLTDVTVEYSRPMVIRGKNDRTGQIWGGQVPWGLANNNFGNRQPMPWRAGANENTVISFSTPVMIEGKELGAGSYGLHMIPYEDGKVTVIFSENTSSWGSFWYDKEEDALRIDVKMEEAPFTNVLTYDFIDFGQNSGTLALKWEKKQIPFEIAVSQNEVLASIRDELRGVQGFGWQGPLSAASYCLNNNVNHDEAIQWADRAIAANRSGQTLGVKAALLFQKGDNEKAVEVAEEAKEIATINELNTFGVPAHGSQSDGKGRRVF